MLHKHARRIEHAICQPVPPEWVLKLLNIFKVYTSPKQTNGEPRSAKNNQYGHYLYNQIYKHDTGTFWGWATPSLEYLTQIDLFLNIINQTVKKIECITRKDRLVHTSHSTIVFILFQIYTFHFFFKFNFLPEIHIYYLSKFWPKIFIFGKNIFLFHLLL